MKFLVFEGSMKESIKQGSVRIFVNGLVTAPDKFFMPMKLGQVLDFSNSSIDYESGEYSICMPKESINDDILFEFANSNNVVWNKYLCDGVIKDLPFKFSLINFIKWSIDCGLAISIIVGIFTILLLKLIR